MAAEKSKSPYQRYQKTPYRYSDLYQRWRQARLNGREGEARTLSAQHSLRFFGPRTPGEILAAGGNPLGGAPGHNDPSILQRRVLRDQEAA